MRKLITLCAATALMSAPALAAPVQFIDFNQEAIVMGEQTLANGAVYTSTSGAQIRLTAGGGDALPFLDGPFSGRPGGLGACDPDDGVGSVCTPNSEDSVSGEDSEFIELGFLNDAGERIFTLHAISFMEGSDHLFSLDNSDALVGVSVDGGAVVNMTFAAVVAAAAAGAYAMAETLRFVGIPVADGGSEFYILSITEIPIPAALPLLLSGLAGLGFAMYRRKAA
jgi:hypothetical protein